ncbi:MAG: hypothetical protein HZB65_03990 [Candidatus Aenigmarchaeota archaeon]|nr:hypothetical protein [Candidatus Aenigmarchaeota archaeon]
MKRNTIFALIISVIIIVSGTIAFADSKISNEISYDIVSELGKPFELKQGQTGFVESENLYIRLNGIRDGRCKSSLQCMWAGDVYAGISLIKDSIEIGTYETSSAGSSSPGTGFYRISIIDYSALENKDVSDDKLGFIVVKKEIPVCTKVLVNAYSGTYGEYWTGFGRDDIYDKACSACAAVCKNIGTDKEGWYTSDGCESDLAKGKFAYREKELISLEKCQVSVIDKSAQLPYIKLPEDVMQLAGGWNFVSAPYSDFTIVKSESSYDANSKPVDAGSYDTNSKDSQAESSYDTCSIKAIYHYNAESGKWDDKFTELEKMKPGLGYFIGDVR